uniref:tRNA-dihydrouridine synthase n=1 Tax=Chenopodium quinoa TaxID=63459 RepID=A0A803MNM1_CHEQI
MDYNNKLVLAPMVRVGTLPLRLLAAEYGADITYGEEIIDHKLVKCDRIVNDYLGTIDVVEKGTQNVVFRTCPEEQSRVVFQMGTSDAVRALKAAQLVRDVGILTDCPRCMKSEGQVKNASAMSISWKLIRTLVRNGDAVLVMAIADRPLRNGILKRIKITLLIFFLHSCNDVAAVDINMGCPRSFSISGGMGAALLSKPETIHDIEKTGVSALAVHGRKVPDRPRDPAKWNEIADVVAALSIPVIANGDVFDYEDIQHIKNATGASSIMVARGALWNASVFSPKGKLPWEEVKKEYVRKSILWDNEVKSTKHTLKEMIMHHSCLELPEGKAVIKSETLADLA